MANSLVAEGYLKIRTDISAMRSELRQATSIFRSAISQMAGVAGGMLAAAGIRSFASELRYVVGQFISVNNMFEQYQVSLGQLFKSEAVARNMIMEIQEMARKTPFRMDTLTQSIVQLKIFGIENEKLIPTMRAVGDAAAASPRGMMDGVQRISYAIGEMKSHGRIMAAEMRQLASAGVPAWDILAKKTGKTIGELRDLMRKGAVDSATYLPLLIEGMGERFEGMMEKQSRTWGGLYSTWQDNLMLIFKDVGRPFFDTAKARLAGMVDFMDTSKFRQFIPRMTEAVRVVSQFADRKITAAFDWLTGPDAAQFAGRMKEVAGEVSRMAQMGHSQLMTFFRSENVRTAARWIGDTAVSLARISRIGFTNVMEFLRGDTWASVVRGAKEYVSQLYGIAKMTFDQAREFFNSRNFEMLTGEARKFVGWLWEIRRVAIDFASEKLSQGMAWLRSDEAAKAGAQFKEIALHVKGIATVTAGNFWKFLTSENLRLIAGDLKDAAFHVAQIAGAKLVEFSKWLNSSEATAIAKGVRAISRNLIYLIDNYGGLLFGVGIMMQFRNEIGFVASGFTALVTTIQTGGLLALLSPTGVLIGGIALIGATFAGARLEGEQFFDYLVMMFGRITAAANGAADAVSRLRRAERREIDLATAVGETETALAGEDTQENVDAAKRGRDDIAMVEKDAQAEVRRRRRELDEAFSEAYKQAYNYSGGQASHEVLTARANEYSSVKGARTELESAQLAAQGARNNLKRLDEEIAEKQNRADAKKSHDAELAAENERKAAKEAEDAVKAENLEQYRGEFKQALDGFGGDQIGDLLNAIKETENYIQSYSGKDLPGQNFLLRNKGGGEVSLSVSEFIEEQKRDLRLMKARVRELTSQQDRQQIGEQPAEDLFNTIGNISTDPNVGWELAKLRRPGFDKMVAKDRGRSLMGVLQHPLISHFRDMARSGLGSGLMQTLGTPDQLRAHQLIANSNVLYKQGGLRRKEDSSQFSKEKDARKLEYLESRNENTLTKKQRGELDRLRAGRPADGDDPAAVAGKTPKEGKDAYQMVGVAAFAEQIQSMVNKTPEADAAMKTADSTDAIAKWTQDVKQNGIKINANSKLPPATLG